MKSSFTITVMLLAGAAAAVVWKSVPSMALGWATVVFASFMLGGIAVASVFAQE